MSNPRSLPKELRLRGESPDPGREGAPQRGVLLRDRGTGSGPNRFTLKPVRARRRRVSEPAVQAGEPDREGAVDREEGRGEPQRVLVRESVELRLLQRFELPRN